jgi:hypothetical protein
MLINFGKLNLSTKKNQDRLDKHYYIRERYVKKYDRQVKTLVPAFSKAYKKKIRYIIPKPGTISKKKIYFKAAGVPIHVQIIGRVSFYYQEFIWATKYQSIVAERVPRIHYYFKPADDLGYLPLPDIYKGTEAAVLQKENKIKAKKYQAEQIYKYLLSNSRDVGAKLLLSTEVQVKVYQEIPKVPDKVLESEVSIVGPYPEQVLDPTTGELTSRCYDYAPGAAYQYDLVELHIWAKRAEWFAKYQKGPKGYFNVKKVPKTHQGWSKDYFGVFEYTRYIPRGYTAYESGFRAISLIIDIPDPIFPDPEANEDIVLQDHRSYTFV